jgi:hypothetical protein
MIASQISQYIAVLLSLQPRAQTVPAPWLYEDSAKSITASGELLGITAVRAPPEHAGRLLADQVRTPFGAADLALDDQRAAADQRQPDGG